MACRIQLPRIADISPTGCCELSCEPIRLGSCEADLMQGISAERTEASGTPLVYHRPDRGASSWDPVYNEPAKLVFLPPLYLTARVQKPTKSTEADERGQKTTWDAVAWISRSSWPSNGPLPQEGDIVGFWNSLHWKKDGVRHENIPNADFFFDVIGVVNDGTILDTAEFVAYELTLKRNTAFTPERRLVELVER